MKGENFAAEKNTKEKILQVLLGKSRVYRLQRYQDPEVLPHRQRQNSSTADDRGMRKTSEKSDRGYKKSPEYSASFVRGKIGHENPQSMGVSDN